MVTGRQRRQRGLAAVVTVAGVLGIWTWSTVRQQEQTEALSRGWVGEQWDVARQCLVGTPIGRGEGAAQVTVALEARLYETLAEASEADAAPTPEALWPTRCVPLLASLRVDPGVLEQDPGDALARLEVLAPRVLRARGEGADAFAVRDVGDELRDLAEAIALLDEAMPYGAEYDAADFPPSPIDPAVVRASMGCPAAAPTRPFLTGAVLDALEGEVSFRLSEDRGAFTLEASGPEGTLTRPVGGPGLSAPRFVTLEGTLAWLDEAGAHLAVEPAREPLPLRDADGPLEGVSRFTPCLVGGRARHLALARGDDVLWAAWPDAARAPRAAIAIAPAPPAEGTRFFCGPEAAAFAWYEEGAWTIVRCEGDACRPLPDLRVGGDLQIALGPEGTVALARGRRTDLPIARRLEGEAWGEPAVARRGVLRAVEGGFVIEGCELEARSADGLAWR